MPDKSRAPATPAAPAVAAPAQAGPAAAPSGLDPSGMRGNDFAQDQMSARAAGDGSGYTPRNVAAAVARQEKGRQTITRILTSAASIKADPADPFGRPTMLKNSAEWVLGGEISLEVLAPIHDGARRGVPAGMKAYFGAGTPYSSAPPAYDATSTTLDASMLVESPTTEAVVPAGGTTVQFLDPVAHGEAQIGTKLIHEIQHDADRHEADPSQGAPSASLNTASSEMYAMYESEFRAYSFQAAEGHGQDGFQAEGDPAAAFDVTAVDVAGGGTKTRSATGLKNARQASILRQMVRNSPGVKPTTSASATLTESDFDGPYGWVTHYYVFDAAFRAFVNGLDTASSANAVNSIRLEAVYDGLDANNEAAILAALGKLDAVDVNVLRDLTKTAPAWKRLLNYPVAVAALGIHHATNDAVPAKPATIKTQRGDTLISIAKRVLGDDIFVQDIRDANPTVTLPRRDTDAVTAGLTLTLPSGKV